MRILFICLTKTVPLQFGNMIQKVISVTTVAISADGEYIVAGETLMIKYIFFHVLLLHLYGVIRFDSDWDALSISADGGYIAAGSDYESFYYLIKDSSTVLYGLYIQVRKYMLHMGKYLSRWRVH